MLSFKPAFSLLSLTLIKRLFSSSSLSAIRVILSFALLRLLMLLPAILIPAHASYSLAFHMMFPACKLNKQDDNIQPCHTLFPNFEPVSCSCRVLLLLDPHTGFSGDRSGGLVLPSLSAFSTVCYDPHSQRLWHSQ